MLIFLHHLISSDHGKSNAATVFKRVEYDPPKDGNCQFASIAYSLQLLDPAYCHTAYSVRRDIVNFLKNNVDWRERARDRLTDQTVSEYTRTMARDGEWGDEDSLFAASQFYRVHIHIRSANQLDYTFSPDGRTDSEQLPVIYLGYSMEQSHYVSCGCSSARGIFRL